MVALLARKLEIDICKYTPTPTQTIDATYLIQSKIQDKIGSSYVSHGLHKPVNRVTCDLFHLSNWYEAWTGYGYPRGINPAADPLFRRREPLYDQPEVPHEKPPIQGTGQRPNNPLRIPDTPPCQRNFEEGQGSGSTISDDVARLEGMMFEMKLYQESMAKMMWENQVSLNHQIQEMRRTQLEEKQTNNQGWWIAGKFVEWQSEMNPRHRFRPPPPPRFDRYND